MGRRGLAARLGRVAIATTVMLAILVPLTTYGRSLPLPSIGLPREVTRGLISQLLLFATVLVLVVGLAGLGNIGLRIRGAALSLILSGPLVCLSLVETMPSHLPSIATVVAVVVWGVLIGLTEEMYGRGLLVTLFGGRKHAALAVIGSAIGFAYLHLPTYAHRYGWRYALLRSTSSAAFSACGAIIRLRSGNIVGLVAFHALDDTRSILAGFDGTSTHDTTDDGSSYLHPFVFGSLLSAAYWMLSRRAIRRSVYDDALV